MVQRDNQRKKAAKSIFEEIAPYVKSAIEDYDSNQNQEIVDIENIDDLTLDDFYNPKMNASFNAFNDLCFLLDDKGNIGFTCEIFDYNMEKLREYTFMRPNLGKAFEDFNITLIALISAIHEQLFEFKPAYTISQFFDIWRSRISTSKIESIDDKADELYYNKIKGTLSLDAVIQAIESLKEEA